ncbi:MAG TPA: aspartate kinase [Lentisphaeria bacterium]|nr:MAG: aspartate kinase [Lentisphaerae bacterium GWF2_38_69]HBM17539.1 aspartate kinase [Lentisphaeria bacterium]
MRGKHTVEKVGGTSMSRFGEAMQNMIIGRRSKNELYNRIFVVSAYGGITNMLLEHKKTGENGVYSYFAAGDDRWESALDEVKAKMIEFNASFKAIGLDTNKADKFVIDRMEGIRNCLKDLVRVRSYGHLPPKSYLPPSREFLSAVGEAHSAYNSTLILQANGINAVYVDLTGWKETQTLPLNEAIRKAFEKIDVENEMPIVTGYTKCSEGMMTHFDRGYSEITFSKIAVITDAMEGIIHKEFHLCTGDPNLIGADNVKVIGNTNFDIADQLADMDMEAIHSSASKEMELRDIPIRVKNAFEPEHIGTLISRDFVSPTPKVDMICGRNDLLAIEVFDSNMVGESGYDFHLLKSFVDNGISYIAKNTNANTITHYIGEKEKGIDNALNQIKEAFPTANVASHKVAIVSVMSTNMAFPGFLARAASALAEANINILAVGQCLRQVNMQFIVKRDKFKEAQVALHKKLVEELL